MINIKIKNMLAINEADIDLVPGKVTGITGLNATGKTSLAILTGALLTGEGNPAGGKVNQKIYLQDNAGFGEALFSTDGELVSRWNAVSGEMSVFESNFHRPCAETVGLVDFCGQMTQPQKIALWEGLFLPPAHILNEKLETRLKPHIQAQLTPHIQADTLEELMRMVREEDIEIVFKTYQSRARNSKRAWTGITGETWGQAKGAGWVPKTWVSSLNGVTVQKLEKKQAFQQGMLRSLHVDQAITRGDVERGKEALAKLEKTRERLDKLRERATELKTSLVEPGEEYVDICSRLTDATVRVKQIRSRGASGSYNPVLECPVCSSTLIQSDHRLLVHDGDGEESRKKAYEQELVKCQERRETIVQEQKEWEFTYLPMKQEFESVVKEGKRVKAEVDHLQDLARLVHENPVELKKDDIERMELKIQETQDQIRIVKSRDDARSIHENIIAYQTIMQIVGPKGVRATCMEENMERFDGVLKIISDLTGWPRVKLDRTYSISIGGRSFIKLCAESDRRRAQLTLQLAISRFTRSPVVILDEVNNLDEKNQMHLADLMATVCGRNQPPAFMICGKELDLAHINPGGINYKMVNGKAVNFNDVVA